MNLALSSLGLVFDIYGSFWLAKSIIIRNANEVREDTSAKWGYNLSAIQSQFKARFEGWIGFSFLAIGFLLQFISPLLSHHIILSWFDLFITTFVLVIGAFGIEAFGKATVIKQSQDLLEKIKSEK